MNAAAVFCCANAAIERLQARAAAKDAARAPTSAAAPLPLSSGPRRVLLPWLLHERCYRLLLRHRRHPAAPKTPLPKSCGTGAAAICCRANAATSGSKRVLQPKLLHKRCCYLQPRQRRHPAAPNACCNYNCCTSAVELLPRHRRHPVAPNACYGQSCCTDAAAVCSCANATMVPNTCCRQGCCTGAGAMRSCACNPEAVTATQKL